MTGGRRRWLLALGVAAVALLLLVGGVALAGSLLSSPHPRLFEKGHTALSAEYLVKHAHGFDRKTSRTPADDQYGNPLEGKLCAGESEIQFTLSRAEPRDYQIQNSASIHNCGDVRVTISPTPERRSRVAVFPSERGLRKRVPLPGHIGHPHTRPG